MSGYTYQQLEVIRERARGIGLRAEFSARTASEDPCLVVLVTKFDSISYFTDLARLTSILIYGGATPLAEEMDQIHATLTSGAAFAPVELISCSEVAPQTGCCGCVWEAAPCDATRCFSPRTAGVAT